MSAGTEISRLVLSGIVGSTMIAHGVRDGRSLEGTAGRFGKIGFRETELQARLSAAVEVGAGAAVLALGLGELAGAATPVAVFWRKP